jgi:hypothetical protein
VFFTIFYVWATINVAGERSAREFERIEHFGRPPSQLDPSSTHVHTADLPNFGHAKKASPAAVDLSLQFIRPLQAVVRQWEQPLDAEDDSSDRVEVSSPRAPPSLI